MGASEQGVHDQDRGSGMTAVTWRRANLSEVWTWVGAGAAGVLGLETLALLIWGLL